MWNLSSPTRERTHAPLPIPPCKHEVLTTGPRGKSLIHFSIPYVSSILSFWNSCLKMFSLFKLFSISESSFLFSTFLFFCIAFRENSQAPSATLSAPTPRPLPCVCVCVCTPCVLHYQICFVLGCYPWWLIGLIS